MHAFISQMKKLEELNKSNRESAKKQLLEKMKLQQQSSVRREPAHEPIGGPSADELRRLVRRLRKADEAQKEKIAALQLSIQQLKRDEKLQKIALYQVNETLKEER